MEFNIKRNVFLEGVQKTLGIVEKKTTMPILNNVLLKAQKDKIRIIATDREISLITDYDAEIVTEGEITLSARKLWEMIKESQGEDIRFLKNEQHQVTMTCDRATYKIMGIAADEYPSVVADDFGEMYPVDPAMMNQLINRTSFAMSIDDTRKNLNGVYFISTRDEKGHIVKMVATDGHRLAIASADVGSAKFLEMRKGIIIPRKGLAEISKLMEGDGEGITIGVKQGMVVMRNENTILKVSLIEGDYPDFHRVIPTDKGVIVEFQKDKVLHALRRMSVISSEKYNGVIISLRRNLMILNSTNPDVGEANDEIEVNYSDHDLEVGFNVNYLVDAIEVIEENVVQFEIRSGMKPGVVKPVTDTGYMCIVMPLKL
ncbi:MAG: DNA polymerase III subunit beta [Smithellaceae bacterium]|nr:DNA polymerase III subunit beta [Smithellaceae bacterium]